MPDSHPLDVAAPAVPRPPAHSPEVVRTIEALVPGADVAWQVTRDDIPTAWVPRDRARDVLTDLKRNLGYRTLYDLTALDERIRTDRGDGPSSDFTVVYHLLSYDRNADVRVNTVASCESHTAGTQDI